MAQLVVDYADGRQQRIRLEQDELLLGREPSCDVCLPDPKVSRRHARIVRDGAGWAIEDLGSINGYGLDGQTVHGRSPLRHGSRLLLGDTKLRLELEQAAARPAAPPQRASGRSDAKAPGFTMRVVEGELVGQTFALAGAKVVVGRSSEADVVLDDPSISRRHASLSPGPDGVEVRDLGSSNGTFVEGQQVTQVRLRAGQQVRFGSLLLRLDGPAAEVRAPRAELSQSTRDVAEHMRARLPEVARPARGRGDVAAAAEQAHDAIDRAAGPGPATKTPTASAPRPGPTPPGRASTALAGAAAALKRRATGTLRPRAGTPRWRNVGVAAALVAVLAAGYLGRHRLHRAVAGPKGAPGGVGGLAAGLFGAGPSPGEIAWTARLDKKLLLAAGLLKAEAYDKAAEAYGEALKEEPIDPRALLGRRLAVARLGQRADLTGGRRELEVGHPFEAVVAASSGLSRGVSAPDGPPLPTHSKRGGNQDPDLLGEEELLPEPAGLPGAESAAQTPKKAANLAARPNGAAAPGDAAAAHPEAVLPEDPTLHQALEALVDLGGLQVAQACGERAQAACASESFAACLAQTACLAAFDPAGELGPALRSLTSQAVGAEPSPGPATAALAASYPQPPLRRAMLSYAAGSYAAALKILRNADSPKSRALQADVAQVAGLIEQGNKIEQAGQAAQALGIYEQAETVDRRLLPREVPSAPRQELARRAQHIFLRQGDEARGRGAWAEALSTYQRGQALGTGYPPLTRAIAGLRARAQKLLAQAGSGSQAGERKDAKGDPCAAFRDAMAACAEDDPVHQAAKEELAACTRKRGRSKKAAAPD